MNFSQSIIAAAVAVLSLSATQQALAFDPAADLTPGSPVSANGVWSYGYNSVLPFGYNFKQFTVVSPNAALNGFHDPSYSFAGSTPTVGNAVVNLGWAVPGQMLLHPGPELREDEAILRFTAPSTSLYNVSLTLLSGDSGETEGWVYLNGSPLASLGITSLNPNYSNAALALTAGDWLDVVVGSFNGDYNFDSTPLQMSISAVPEPGTWAMFGVGLAGLSLWGRRRSGQAQQPSSAALLPATESR